MGKSRSWVEGMNSDGNEAVDLEANVPCTDRRPAEKSYDNDPGDIEGMLVTLGVLSALIIGLIISLQCTVAPEEMDRGDFAYLLRSDAKFRHFAKVIWERESKSFLVPVGPEPTDVFNISTVLDDQTDGWKQESYQRPGNKEFEATLLYMQASFPMANMRVWKAWTETRTNTGHGGSDFMTRYSSISFACLAVSLLSSVALYVSFAYSPAKEDYDAAKEQAAKTGANFVPPESLRSWSRFGMPATVAGYVLVLVGSVTFTASSNSINHMRYVYSLQAMENQAVLFHVTIPLLILGCFVAALSLYLSERSHDIQNYGKLGYFERGMRSLLCVMLYSISVVWSPLQSQMVSTSARIPNDATVEAQQPAFPSPVHDTSPTHEVKQAWAPSVERTVAIEPGVCTAGSWPCAGETNVSAFR